MKTATAILLVIAVLAFAGPAGAYLYELPDTGGELPPPGGSSRGTPGGDFFPNHDDDYIIINLTNNDYREYTAGESFAFPHGFYIKYPALNADGTRLAAVARAKIDGVSPQYEIWVMDYDSTTHSISNPFQLTSNANGISDTLDPEYTEVYENSQISWSLTDPDKLLFLEVHKTTANLLKEYDFGTDTFTTVYDPALDTNGYDITNPGYLGADDTKYVLGTGYNTGNDKIVVFDGTYPSTTISPEDKNLDPASTYDGTVVSYYSTQSTYGEGSVYSEYSGGSWSFVADGFGDPSVRTVPGYWAYRSGKTDDRMLALLSENGWSATGLGLYDADGYLISNLTGAAGTDFVWCYANHNWGGPNGEILFRAEEYSHTGYGTNVFLALERPDEVWVDDDWDGPDNCGGHSWGYNAFATIQEAIDAVQGSTIHVAPGTYVEQLHIAMDDLDIVGSGVGQTIIKSPATLTEFFGTNYPIVFVDGCTGVDISGVTIDGDGQGDANYRFVGVAFWNAGGSLTDAEVLNIMDTPFSGAQHGIGIYAYNDTGGPYTVVLADVHVEDFQKNAMALSGDGLTVDLDRVTCIGAGPTDVTAQNGIQIGYGAGGTVDDCLVTDIHYSPMTWMATGILFYDATTIDLAGTTCERCGYSIDFYDADGSVSGCSVLDPYADGLYADTSADVRSGRPPAQPFVEDGAKRSGRTTQTVAITDSRFIGNGVTDSWGVSSWAGGTSTVTMTGCEVTGWDYGVVAYEDGGTVDYTVNDCLLYGNTSYGFYTNATAARAVQNAENNWWGDPTGPQHPTLNPGGLGNDVSDNVDFDPWLTGNVVCVPDPEYLTATEPVKTISVDYLGGGSGLLYGYSITFTWDAAIASTDRLKVTEGDLLTDIGGTFFYAATDGSSQITVDSALLGAVDGATGPGTLFTIEFTGVSVGTSDIDITINNVRDKDNVPLSGFFENDGLLIVDVSGPSVTDVFVENVTLAHTDDYIKDGDAAQVTATVTDDDPAFGLSDIEADLTGLGGGAADNPDSYVGGVATWNLAAVTCTPSDGTVNVTVTATDAIGNTDSGSDDITADNTAPTAVADFDAAPGHQKCDLTWTMGTDNFVLAGVTVRRAANVGDYPVYPLFVGAWPAVDGYYPGDETAGTEAYNGSGSSATDAVVDRNIYYYQAFCYDEAGNYGPAAAAARDLATNYWLGDVATTLGFWGYNGLVNDADIDKLGGAYHQAPAGSPENEMDVGPTVHPTYSRVGLPTPDNFVGFEDLMIFAMNYGVVSARVVPFLPEPAAGSLELALEGARSGDGEVTVALRLEGNAGEVKGLTASVGYDPTELEFVSVRMTDDMSSPIAPVFFWSEPGDNAVTVDLAVLGTGMTIGGSGEVAVLTFRPLDDEYEVWFDDADLRGSENESFDAELKGYGSSVTPKAFRLAQNSPNPFNPVTSVAYDVPEEARVAIRVYDVTGRLVRTLIDRDCEPGRHVVSWDGVDENGKSVGSGVYFCTMNAPGYRGERKMLLLK